MRSLLAILTLFVMLLSATDSKVARTCGEREIYCKDGKSCIAEAKVCDGEQDCEDSSDEENCDLRVCQQPHSFKCSSDNKLAACIPMDFVCNGIENCPNGEDEMKCKKQTGSTEPAYHECSQYEYKCDEDDTCIRLSLRCDGKKDCRNGSDETVGCRESKSICPGFFCSNRKCLDSRYWVCDGVDDCGDSSDEADCRGWNCDIVSHKFLCRDNETCIDLAKACDGGVDCSDQSDESRICTNDKDNCSTKECMKGAKCFMTPSTGPVCVCPEGYRLSSLNSSCVDIDECRDVYGVCDQGCVNTRGSYRCTCSELYGLKADGRTCVAHDRNAVLYYTTQTEVVGVHLENRLVFPVAGNLTRVVGVSSNREHLYWTNLEEETESIVKSNKDGSNQQILLTSGLEAPEDLAIDWVTGNIYFTDNTMQHIAVCSNNGEICTVLVVIDVHHPRGIALWPERGQMFWTDWGAMPMIARASMDGENSIALIKKDIHWPNGIALDIHNQRVFWVDAKLGTMESARTDGTDRRIILNDIPKHPYGTAIFEDKIYWSDWITKSIHVANKFTGKNHSVIIKDSFIYAIDIFHPANQPHHYHPCMNSRCTHLCLLAEDNKSTCACPDGMVLGVDRSRCVRSREKQKLFLGISNYLVEIEHTAFGRHKILELHALSAHVHEMAYNSVNSTIIIADNTQKIIFEFDERRNKLRKLIDSHLGNVTGLAIDYLAHNLYWTDGERHVVEVYSFTTQHRAIVSFFQGLEQPIAISVIPEDGKMFIALGSYHHAVHIDQLALNGEGDRVHVFEDDIGASGIQFVADHESQTLYWADTDSDRISFSDFESKRAFTFREQLQRPYSLAIVDDDIFWSQVNSPMLYWTHRSNLGTVKRIKLATPKDSSALSLPPRIPLLSSMRPTVMDHPCQHNNGGCSHICVARAKFTAACLCTTGLIFKDARNKTCIETIDCEFRCRSGECLTMSRRCNGHSDCRDHSDEADCDAIQALHDKKKGKLICALDEFACQDGTRCIENENRCDSVKDCRDASDEVNCGSFDSELKCHRHQHVCDNGRCIDFSAMCDGFDDCGDKSDEYNCYDLQVSAPQSSAPLCGSAMFQCTSGTCIAKSWECDGRLDCSDGSDEHEKCESNECQAGMGKCRMGQCIDQMLICDGHNDCGDNSDEADCDGFGKRRIVCGDEGVENSKTFQCSSDPTLCLGWEAICNGTAECPRGEDEVNCHGCGIHEFECVASKECIHWEFHCDNDKDCSDGSDEVNCEHNMTKGTTVIKELPCGQGMFDCKNGRCIDQSRVCDGVVDCESAADEKGLCSTACSANGTCEQKCRPTPSGAVCSCHSGFRLHADNRKCIDIDECDEEMPCAQICRNTLGSYRCGCFPDFMLRTDKVSCKSIESEHALLFSTYDEVRSLNDYPIALKVLLSANGSRITGLDVNIRKQLAYFTTFDHGVLYEADMRTGVIRAGLALNSPMKVAVDWVTGNVYVISHTILYDIKVCSFHLMMCNTVVQASAENAIKTLAVDAVNRRLLFVMIKTIAFETPTSRIVASQLDGSTNKTILTKVGYIAAVAVDTYKKLLYFVDSHARILQAVSYISSTDRTPITVIRRENAINFPSALTIYENVAFIVNVGSKEVVKCKLYGDNRCSSINLNVFNADNVVVYGLSRQKVAPNPCELAHCSGMCVQSQYSYECLCHDAIVSETQICTQASNEMQRKQVSSVHHPIESSSGNSSLTTVIIFILLLIVILFVVIGYMLYKRKQGEDSFIVSMHFQNPLADNVHKSSTQNILYEATRQKLQVPNHRVFSKSNGSEILLESQFYDPASPNAGKVSSSKI